MAKSIHSDPGLRDLFSTSLFTEILFRLPDEFSLAVQIRPDGSRYYQAGCIGFSWNEETIEELAAAVLNTVISPPEKRVVQPMVQPILDTASPMDIIDSIEAARISGMTRHQVRAAIIKGKLSQVPDKPPVSLRRGEVLEWAKRERTN